MIIHETLQELGISTRETDIYLALLRLGPSSVRDIAVAAEINRGTTYEVLKDLKSKHLVSLFPKGKRHVFCAEPPERLLALADQRQQAIQTASLNLANDIVPDLSAITADQSTTAVRHYEGDDGIEYVLRDILSTMAKQEDKTYRIYSSKQIRKYLYRPYPNFTRQRVEKNIYVRAIAIGEGGEDAPLSDRKWIPAENVNPAASYVAIYGPRCAMISLSRGDYPTAVIIESQGIAEVLRLSFDSLWQLLPETRTHSK
jgi:sugar-specific transcriptional regulator TrmB